MNIPKLREIKEAKKTLNRAMKGSPIFYSYKLSEKFLGNIHIKLETKTEDGLYRGRGILYKILKLKNKGKIGIIPCKKDCMRYLPYKNKELASSLIIVTPKKTHIEEFKSINTDIEDYEELKKFTKELAEKKGYVYIDPFQDTDIIKAYGTIALELLRDEKSIEIIVVPARKGTIISGIGIFTKEILPQVKIIGVFKDDFLDLNETTSEIIKNYTDGLYPVKKDSLKEAIKLYQNDINDTKIGDPLALALLLEGKIKTKNRSIALIT